MMGAEELGLILYTNPAPTFESLVVSGKGVNQVS